MKVPKMELYLTQEMLDHLDNKPWFVIWRDFEVVGEPTNIWISIILFLVNILWRFMLGYFTTQIIMWILIFMNIITK